MKIKLPKNKIGKKGIIVAVIAVLIIALVCVGFILSKKKPAGNESSFSEYTVSSGDIAVVISGSGTIKANEQYDITSLVTGDVLSARFEEGDEVEEGDILYQIDTENVQNSIEKAKNSVENAKMSYEDALDQVC